MFVNEEGLNLSDKELRAFLVMKLGFLNWQCYYSCKECVFEDDGVCMIKNISDEIDALFKGLVV